MEKNAALLPSLVQDFVAKAHGDFAGIQELLTQEPLLLNASWDWGGGDWETALGAASHMGRRDIAEFLLAQGARIDIFAAAMLGDLALVQAILRLQPSALHSHGPHGITLLAHAQAGGVASHSIVQFLQKFQEE